MKIVRVELLPVTVPRRYALKLGTGVYLTESKYTLIKLETDEGFVGLGEVSHVDHTILQDFAAHVVPKLLGASPIPRKEIVSRTIRTMEDQQKPRLGRHIASAVDMALWDLAAKKCGVNVGILLGTQIKRIPVAWIIGIKDTDSAVLEAVQKVKEGFNTLKLKIGMDFKSDLERVSEVRKAVGKDIKIRVDVNGAWRGVKQVLRNIEQLEVLDLELLEQPLPSWDIMGMKKVTQHSSLTIAADESVWSPSDAMQIIQHEAADMFYIYVSEAGGITEALNIVTLAENAGLMFAFGSMLELGVGTAAGAWSMAASGSELACDIIGPLHMQTSLTARPFEYGGGYLDLPEEIGLGVKLADRFEQFLTGEPLVFETD